MKSRRVRAGRFTTLENEREQQRKLYEDNLRKKKEQLYFEFEKQEEVLKYTKMSIECHNDVNFKYEHDRVINLKLERENKLNDLKRTLQEVQDINKIQEPLPEGQSLFGQTNKGTNLTSIFSKSYYRSTGLQIMSSNQQKSREDVNDYIAYMRDELKQVEDNLKNEQQRQHQLTKSMQELFKTKQKFRDELHDLEFLNDTADRRFHDIAAVQFKAKEKKLQIQKDLNAVQKSLKEYSQIGEKYKEKQLVKMKHGEKIKKTAEEIITHDMIRQDELERENHLLQKQIQLEVMKQQSIIEKRSESKYILKHIDCFTKFEKLFLDGPIKEKEIEELYEQNVIRKSLIMPGSEGETPQIQGNPYMFSQFPQFAGTRQRNSTVSSNDSRSPQSSHNVRSSFNIQEEDNRLTLIHTINKFASEHPQGARDLIDEMIKVYNNFSYVQEGLNTTHSRLLEDKARKQQEIQDLDSNLQNIQQMNSYLDEMERDPKFEKEMLAVPESFDSGLLMIPKALEKLNIPSQTNLTSQTNIKSNKDSKEVMSTVNILKYDNFQNENEKIKNQVQNYQNFVFNFFSNYCESAIRLCQILELIYQSSVNVCPISIESLSKSTIQFIKDIWAGKFEELTESFSKVGGKKRRQTTIQRIGTQELLNGEEQQEKYFKHIESEKFGHQEILQLFEETFPNKKEEAEKFYNLIKSERIIWFFCNIEQIRNYLFNSKRNHGIDQGCISVIDNLDDLKQQGLTIFENNLQNVMELMVKILLKVKDSGNMCLKVIRATYPEYNPKRRYHNKNIRENEEIREAKFKATTKNENYFRNNDPLMEDFIILRKEDNHNMMLLDSQDQDGFNEEQQQQKRDQDKNNDQINLLIEYIKKTKNNGQLLQEQKKQQIQQMQKNKTKNTSQDSNSISYTQGQVGGSSFNGNANPNTSDGGNMNHRGSQHSVNFDLKEKSVRYSLDNQVYGIQNSMQQFSSNGGQSSSQSNQNQSNQDSMDGRYKEDINRFKHLNKAENQVIEKERERIHNLSKLQQLQLELELKKIQEQKDNKFFISNEISQINERLHGEKKAPQKEKLIRNFSESQLVLSKVDRMDRFSGFIGPAVLEHIQDEKNQMVRTLRGELYQPNLNYLKSNNTYNIRKQIAQEQLHYLHEVKLQQTVQLNQSQNQSTQSAVKNQTQNQLSFNQGSNQKGHKQEKSFSPERNSETKDQFNQQFSHFHPVNSSQQPKVTHNQLKRIQENEEKNKKKEVLNLKLNDIKSALKLPSAGSTRGFNSDTRPFTQGSKSRTKIDQDSLHKGVSSHKKETMNSSSSNFFSNKYIRNTPTQHEIQTNRLYTPLSNNQYGISDLQSSENSLMFNNQNSNNNGPYNNQNLKFYQRYTSPEGDAFFDSILNGPILSSEAGGNRPKTQQHNSRKQKEQLKYNYDINRPLNNLNQNQQKPQSSHEGKRNLFYKPEKNQKYGFSSKTPQKEDSVVEQEYYQKVHTQPAYEKSEYFGEQTDAHSVSYTSSHTNITTNRPLHNQQHQFGYAKKHVEQENH